MTEIVSKPTAATGPQTGVITAAFAILAAASLAIGGAISVAQAMLFLTGAALGLALYHAGFGFTAAFRVFMANGRSAGIRAQMIMLGLACILFYPVLAAGTMFGKPVGGFVAPAGTSVAVGSFIFGIGMQLGGACASGTLFTVGGGSTRMLMTLIFFIIGSVFGLEHLPWWHGLPSPPAISTIKWFGWPVALAINLAIFAMIWLIVSSRERSRHGSLESLVVPDRKHPETSRFTLGGLLSGPWPLIAGAVALALLNFATLYQAGRPWGITGAFPIWGAKVMSMAGADMSQWSSWSSVWQQRTLQDSVFNDVTSVMNFGIILGAMIAAVLASRFKPGWRIPPGQIIASIVGGLMLGYGARLAYGCNIGAFFSGVASGSLHGWLWIICAIPGNWIGMHLRPLFGMAVEWPARSD